jgi:hypothetical protein
MCAPHASALQNSCHTSLSITEFFADRNVRATQEGPRHGLFCFCYVLRAKKAPGALSRDLEAVEKFLLLPIWNSLKKIFETGRQTDKNSPATITCFGDVGHINT